MQVSPPRDLSSKDDAETVPDKAFMFPTKAIAGETSLLCTSLISGLNVAGVQ